MSTAMQANATIVANTARIAVELGGMDVDAAIDYAVNTITSDAHDALKRTGAFTCDMTTERLDEWRFLGSVAEDTRNNTPRPSTGPMRNYVRALVTA